MIHEAHLRKAGWSEAEITHAKRIIADVEHTRGKALHAVEHATLILLTTLIVLGATGAGFALAQLSGAVPWTLVSGVSLVIGGCIGALAHRAMHTLRSAVTHARAAIFSLLVASLLCCGTAVWVSSGNPFVVAPSFTIGLAATILPATRKEAAL